MTVDEVAEYLQVPKATLYKWRSEGSGPPGMRIGKWLRYRWRDLEQWIAEQAAKEFE
jgi:excisionase family DNA binding protein